MAHSRCLMGAASKRTEAMPERTAHKPISSSDQIIREIRISGKAAYWLQ